MIYFHNKKGQGIQIIVMIGIVNMFETEAKLQKITLKWFIGVISKLYILGKKSLFQHISETSERI